MFHKPLHMPYIHNLDLRTQEGKEKGKVGIVWNWPKFPENVAQLIYRRKVG